jgi:molybdate transport system regulatory protein
MKISARNIFHGRVTALKLGAVNSEVELQTAGGDRIVATVTNESVDSLDLAVGREASALVKASSVVVMTESDGVKLSARNCLAGKITNVARGAVSAAVVMVLPSGAFVHATITSDAAMAMDLKPGLAATAIFKASSVIVATGV